MGEADELIEVAQELGISGAKLSTEEGSKYIASVLSKFNPHKTTGHLAIRNNSISIPLEKYEFSYSQYLADEPVFVFFDQGTNEKNEMVIIRNGRQLCSILSNSFGMEYFVSNEKAEYLIAVNWYVIEGAGSAIEWLKKLQLQDP